MLRSRFLLAPIALVLTLVLTLPLNTVPTNAQTSRLETYSLPTLSLGAVQNAVLPGSITNDRSFVLGGIGSDLFRSSSDPAGEYWMVTDRGPNGQIPPPSGGAERRTFPVPEFTPLILKVRTTGNAITVTQTIPILDSSGVPVTGLSNLLTKDEAPYDITATNLLNFNPNGLDTEGLVRTSNGEFWLVDEYRPSLVNVAANGRVIRRYVPNATPIITASYPVSATLPAIFDKRRSNRGFEAIAISPDETKLFLVLQSPLSNPDINAARTSRNTRILVFDIPTQTVVAEYVYRFEVGSNFDVTTRVRARPQDEMKLSGAIALSANELLILERTDWVSKVYRVNLSAATNILGSQWDNAATTPTLEQTTDLTAAGIVPLPKTLAVDFETLGLPDKIEGITLIDNNTIAAANDNDFDINASGRPNTPPLVRSTITVVSLPTSFRLPNQVAAGDVTPTSAVLWARPGVAGNVVFEYTTDPSFASGVISATVTVTDTLLPAKLTVTGLVSGTQYVYRATDAAGARDTGRFRTPADLTAGYRGLRFGVSGDWRGEIAPYPSISNAASRNLDFFVLHGDTIYSDYSSPDVPLTQTTTLEQYRLKHNEVYATRFLSNTLGDLRASTAVFATIDDHEITNDFQGGAPASSDPRFATSSGLINETALYTVGMRAFYEFNPLVSEFYGNTGDPRLSGKPKLYRYRTFGRDAALFVTDARSFRDQGITAPTSLTDTNQINQFLAATYAPTRTMLGNQQFSDLTRDLLAADRAGITWKFVLIPEPIQNLGVLSASDRYEGYAAERTRLLSFIEQNGIQNVVFIAADIHGTLVNNLTYASSPLELANQRRTRMFEIATGSVAFDAPFGPTVVDLASSFGLITPTLKAVYDASPRQFKDAFIEQLTNSQITPLGYDPLGLQGSPISATLTAGSYVATHTYGWSEFEIGATQALTITTYGIDAYNANQIISDTLSIKSRSPQIVSQFVVQPQQRTLSLPFIGR